jgi:hypothetical protein
MHSHSRSLAPLAMSLLLLTAGCGSPDPSATCVAVSLTVTYKGQPVEDAQVTFTANGEGARTCQGVTDESGRAVLGTFGVDDGAQPGPYKVSISKSAEGGSDSGLSDPALAGIDTVGGNAAGGQIMDPTQAYRDQMNSDGSIKEAKSKLPAKYVNPETSGVAFKVESSGSNDFKVDLKD